MIRGQPQSLGSQNAAFSSQGQTSDFSLHAAAVLPISIRLITNRSWRNIDGKSGKFRGTIMKSPWEFQQNKKSGLWISELLPKIGAHVGRVVSIARHAHRPTRSSSSDDSTAYRQRTIRAAIAGAWTLYGLGTENASMPGFISISPAPGTAQNYGSAFLPAVYQGTTLGGSSRRGGPVPQQGGFVGHKMMVKFRTSAIHVTTANNNDNSWILSNA